MLSESSRAASYKLIARAKSPWADLASPSWVSCACREDPMRSQAVKPKSKRIGNQTRTACIIPGDGKSERTGRILSANDIVANLLTCEPTHTSILFRYRNINFASSSAYTWSPFHRSKDRKSTRLNSSHVAISYAVFCLKKKKKNTLQS